MMIDIYSIFLIDDLTEFLLLILYEDLDFYGFGLLQ